MFSSRTIHSATWTCPVNSSTATDWESHTFSLTHHPSHIFHHGEGEGRFELWAHICKKNVLPKKKFRGFSVPIHHKIHCFHLAIAQNKKQGTWTDEKRWMCSVQMILMNENAMGTGMQRYEIMCKNNDLPVCVYCKHAYFININILCFQMEATEDGIVHSG